MKTYIALLRGINVGGHRKIKMTDLKIMLNEIGFKEVVTYIQSGNVVFNSSEIVSNLLAEKIKDKIAETFGFEVPVLVKKHEELKSIFDKNSFTEIDDIQNKKVYFTLLKETPLPDLAAAFCKETFHGEQFELDGDCVYLNYSFGAGKAKLTNNQIESKLQVSATSRNYRTVVKLLELAVLR